MASQAAAVLRGVERKRQEKQRANLTKKRQIQIITPQQQVYKCNPPLQV